VFVAPRDRFGSALDWIVSLLDEFAVPYQVVGGLAALAHGATRPLHDIDLYAPLAGQGALLETLGRQTLWGPAPFTDEAWDLVFMKLDFKGVRIEIGDTTSEPRYFDRERSRWVKQVIDFSSSQRMSVLGVFVDVMPLQQPRLQDRARACR